VVGLVMILSIALCIVAVGLATDEAPGWAAYLVLLLPVALFAFWFVVGYAWAAPALLYPLLPIGAGAIALALRPSGASAVPSDQTSKSVGSTG
jgi:hypothetical protein